MSDGVQRVMHTSPDGTSYALFSLRVQLDEFTVTFLAAPTTHPDEVLVTMLRPAPAVAGCAVGVIVDQEVRRFENPQLSREGSMHGYRVTIDFETLRRMATAERVAGRVCEREWRLSPANAALLRDLVARIDEERAWSAAGTQGGEAPPASPPQNPSSP